MNRHMRVLLSLSWLSCVVKKYKKNKGNKFYDWLVQFTPPILF